MFYYFTIDLKKYPDPADFILDYTQEGRGLDVAIECVGLPEMWEKMFSIVRKGGYVHLFGGCASGTSVNIDTRRLHYDEVKIISSFHHTPQYFREALEIISSGKIDVEKLITKRMDMKYAKRAIESAISANLYRKYYKRKYPKLTYAMEALFNRYYMDMWKILVNEKYVVPKYRLSRQEDYLLRNLLNDLSNENELKDKLTCIF